MTTGTSTHCCCLVASVESDSETPWTIALQAPLSMGFPGKNTGVSCLALLQRIFPTQGIEPASLWSPALAGGFFTISATWEAPLSLTTFFQNQWEHNGQDTTVSQSPLWSKLVLSHPALVVWGGGGGDFSLFQGDKILYTKLASMFVELPTNLDKLISCKMDTSVLKQLCLRNVVELTSQVCPLLPCDHYRDGQSHQARTGPQATKIEKRQTKVIEITKGK